MNILVVSDEESPALWDYYHPGKLDGIDLIISCGDLKANYLSFLVSMAHCPVLYVHGNHDTSYEQQQPEGCDCIDDKLVTVNGVRILGLGGCRWYHPGPYQITEAKMRLRIRALRFPLWRSKGVDIVVTHAPPQGVGDGNDNAHIGFECFLQFLDKYRPKYLLHGHVHMNYGTGSQRIHTYGSTEVINCSGRYLLQYPDVPFPEKDRSQVIWKNGEPKLKEYYE